MLPRLRPSHLAQALCEGLKEPKASTRGVGARRSEEVAGLRDSHIEVEEVRKMGIFSMVRGMIHTVSWNMLIGS